jgi:glutamyl-Q tRNA(Asp) synthetase
MIERSLELQPPALMRASPVFRFAPSPNGELHIGHALSTLVGYDMARRLGGRFLVRIEDIDIARCRPEYVYGLFQDLAWLGIRWEEPVLRQSEHFPAYRRAAQQLEQAGLLYPCFATRIEIAAACTAGAADPDGVLLYPGVHKGLPSAEIARRQGRGEPFALRLDMDRALNVMRAKLGARPLTFTEINADGTRREVAAAPERWGDAVIVRKDIPASYHLAVVVDDARQGITHVTRGLDLYAATDLHRLLQVLLELPEPLYHHHRLVTDVTGRKLTKSARDTSLRSLREGGWSALRLRESLGLTCAVH